MTRNSNRNSRLLILLVALIWAAEAAWIQEYTLTPYFKKWSSWVFSHGVRWALDFLIALLLIQILPRRVLSVLMAASALFALTLLTYYQHFHIPLSEQVLFTQAGEATEFSGFALQLLDYRAVFILLAALALKLLLLKQANFSPWAAYAGSKKRKLFLLGLVLIPIILIWTASMQFMPTLRHLTMFNSWTIYAETYGYLPAWAINYYWNSDPLLRLEKAVSQTKPPPDNRIDFRIPLQPDVIAIIQVESLDFPMLFLTAPENSEQPGKPVMPYLNSLLADSLLFKVKYDYSFGTATADFEMISGMIPGGDRIPYKVEGFPFGSIDSLARIAEQKGYATSILHGNHGFFYGRENAFKATGFAQVLFTPEMEAAGIKLYKDYVLDRDTFELAASLLKPGKNLQFIITMTSHGPWTYQPQAENELFPESDDKIQNYFNSMRYVDNVIADYVEKLPDGSLLVLFGDHVSAQKYDGHELGVVPFLVYRKGHKLHFRTEAENDKALSGELVRTDLIGVFFKMLRSYPDCDI